MVNKRFSILGFLVLLMVVCQMACGTSRMAGSHSRSVQQSRGNFADETDILILTMDVKPAMTRNDLCIDIDLDAGALSWVLRDPEGEVQWTDALAGPARFNEVHRLDLITGEWVLELTLEDATGQYDIQWEATD